MNLKTGFKKKRAINKFHRGDKARRFIRRKMSSQKYGQKPAKKPTDWEQRDRPKIESPKPVWIERERF